MSSNITLQVAASTDDATVYYKISTSTWTIALTDNYCYSGYSSSLDGAGIGCGAIFRSGSAIKLNAKILTAYIQVCCCQAESANTVNSKIVGVIDANPAAFTTIADYQARRGTDCGGAGNTRRTTAEVFWNAIAAWTLNVNYQSPSIVSIIQEMVNLGTYIGNFEIHWDDHNKNTTVGTLIYRNSYSYNLSAIYCMKLYIEYVNPLVLETDAATNVTQSAARLNGAITDLGGEANVATKIYWGLTDGGTNPNSWDHVIDKGNLTVGSFYSDISSLPMGTLHYFKVKGTTAWGDAWGATLNFTTLSPTDRIAGTVTLSGVPVQNALVMVMQQSTHSVPAWGGWALTDAAGHYTFDQFFAADLVPDWHVCCCYDVKASLTTTFTGADNDLTFAAVGPAYNGVTGNAISMTFVNPGGTNPLVITVVGTAISVQLATNTGAIISTADDIMAALNADVNAKLLILTTLAQLLGTGIVEALALTHLGNGKYYHAYSLPYITPVVIP